MKKDTQVPQKHEFDVFSRCPNGKPSRVSSTFSDGFGLGTHMSQGDKTCSWEEGEGTGR